MPTALRRLFSIQPGEEQLTLLLFAQMFLIGIGNNFVETSVFPLFLSTFSAGTLPYLYIINAVVVALLSAAYLRLGRRLTFTQGLRVLLGFLAALTLAYWLALTLGGGRPITFVLPVLFQIAVNLGQVAFWTMAGRLLTLRQSKRLFGPIGAGQWVAIVLTGFLIPGIVRAIGTVNLLLVGAFGFAGALALLVIITGRYRAALDTVEEPGVVARQESPGAFLRNPYILLMFGLTIASWLSFFFVDNIFFNRISARFPDPADLSAFMGLYLAALGIFTLFNNTFLAGLIINRLGVRVGLYVLPGLLFVVTLVFSVVGVGWGLVPLLFWLATLNRVLDLGFMFSVDQTAQAILYQPLPAAERSRVQTIDNGIVRMVAVGLAGVSLLLLNRMPQFTVVHVAMVLLVIIIAWLAVAFLTTRAYPQALMAALSRRRLTGVELSLGDSDSIAVLTEALRSPRPGSALYALGLLAQHRPEALAEAAPDLLRHPEAAVRREAARQIEALGLAAGRGALLAAAEGDPDPSVRGAAWRALAAVGGAEMEPALRARLAAPEPETRLGALLGLRHYGSDAGQAAAEATLAALAASADSAERRLAVRALGQPAGADCALLSRLLADRDDGVRREALAVAGRAQWPDIGPDIGPDVWPDVVAALGRRATQMAAVAALRTGGEAARTAVVSALGQDNQPVELLVGLARAAGRMGGEAATTALAAHLDHPSDTVRTEALLALTGAGYRASGEITAAVRRQIAAETAHAAWLLAGLRDCLAAGELGYLRRVLQGQFEAARDRIYLLLALLVEPAAMRDVREVLGRGQQATETRRAYALEVLELGLPADLKAMVMPLSEELPAAARLQRLGGLYDVPILPPTARVEVLLRGDGRANRWLEVTRLFAAGQVSCTGPDLPELLRHYQTSSDPILRETAFWTAARLGYAPAAAPSPGERAMLTTIEKVIFLKDVDLFAETPDELLAEIAGLLTEVERPAGVSVFDKGDAGDSLYIIVSGEVRIHDGDYTLNTLGESEVFGEMALLDPEPRMAAATAEMDTLLLRLEQAPFYELMDTRSEVARGVIRVLSRRLRQRVQEVAALRAA